MAGFCRFPMHNFDPFARLEESMRFALSVVLFVGFLLAAAPGQTSHSSRSHRPANCPAGIDAKGDVPFQQVDLPPAQKCSTGNKNGFLIPDPKCTPGAVNPT